MTGYATDEQGRPKSLTELWDWQLNKTFSPPRVFIGFGGLDSSGNFVAVEVNPSGYLSVIDKPATGINGGDITVGTSEVEMAFTGTTRSLMIQSDPDNTGRVWIGLTGVTNTGGNAFVQLEPGDAIEMDLDDDSAAIFAISDTAAQNVLTAALT